jgi:hypothetical protein
MFEDCLLFNNLIKEHEKSFTVLVRSDQRTDTLELTPVD